MINIRTKQRIKMKIAVIVIPIHVIQWEAPLWTCYYCLNKFIISLPVTVIKAAKNQNMLMYQGRIKTVCRHDCGNYFQ